MTLRYKGFLLIPLFWVTVANYVAQIPYYLYNYYFPYHVWPTVSSIVLLGMTLLWFLAGYIGVQRQRRYGNFLLVSFLLFEVLFYLHSVISGAFFFQMQNPSLVIKVVFLMGYVSGAVAGYYAYLLIRGKYKKTEL